MNPKQQAKELVEDFYKEIDWVTVAKPKVKLELAKKLALNCVTRIMNANPQSNPFNSVQVSTIVYWSEVKKEIEKL